jgi:hypothetical protein
MIAAVIDAANGDENDADILTMASKARKVALDTEGPLPNHLTSQMNREITPIPPSTTPHTAIAGGHAVGSTQARPRRTLIR